MFASSKCRIKKNLCCACFTGIKIKMRNKMISAGYNLKFATLITLPTCSLNQLYYFFKKLSKMTLFYKPLSIFHQINPSLSFHFLYFTHSKTNLKEYTFNFNFMSLPFCSWCNIYYIFRSSIKDRLHFEVTLLCKSMCTMEVIGHVFATEAIGHEDQNFLII